ncbi:MAG: hypothetical protein ACQERD_02570 [Campylobacterota bacterium]
MKSFKYYLIMVALISQTFFSLEVLARPWQEIKQSGVLKIAIRDMSSLGYDSKSKDYPGFLYEMALAFANENDLKLEVYTVDSFSDFWKSDDVVLLKSQKNKTPDIYNRVDLVPEAFTITAKREKLVHMSPYIENMELFFGDINKPIKNYYDLVGKKILLYESMAFLDVFKKELNKREIPYNMVYVDKSKDSVKPKKRYEIRDDKVNLYVFPVNEKYDGKLIYHYLANKTIDVSINDSLGIVFRLFSNSYYSENIRPYFPVSVKKKFLAWGLSHNTKVLNKKVDEFIKEYKLSNKFSKKLEYYTGMTLEDYNELVSKIK